MKINRPELAEALRRALVDGLGAGAAEDNQGPPRREVRDFLFPLVSPSFDYYGSAGYHKESITQVNGANDDLLIEGPTVPAKTVWYIIHATLSTNDTAVGGRAATLERFVVGAPTVYVVLAGGNEFDTTVEATGAGTPGRFVTSRRPFYLPPGWALRGRVAALTVGTRISITYTYVPMALGEYVAAP